MRRLFLSLGLCSTIFSALPEDPSIIAPLPEEISVTESIQHYPTAFPTAPLVPQPRPERSSFAAVGLSYLIPGLGHIYLGDTETASYLIAATTTGSLISRAEYIDEPIRDFSSSTIMNTWFYGTYAAYRDVRLYNSNHGYKYKMPTDSFKDLALAPVNPYVLKKPEVWGGILGGLAAAFGVTYLHSTYHDVSASRAALPIRPLVALPVAIGEETFFRGYIQPLASEYFSPIGGLATSSILFGAAHIPNAYAFYPDDPAGRNEYYLFSLPLITAFGVYTGWLAQKNCSLKETVAIHAWYDFTLFMLQFLSEEAALTQPTQFMVQVPF